MLYFFLTKKGKHLLGLASPGGAGRNKTLGQKEFQNLSFIVPEFDEQKKLADFITSINQKIQLLQRKKILLEKYKKGVIQQIFDQTIRFKDDENNEFPKWELAKLATILDEHGEKSRGKDEVFSVSVHKGLVNQIEHLGRSFAASDTSKYKLSLIHI